jgi:hypothetical protein
MINYRCNVKPRTNKYAHGGHVHNFVEKAYQGHSFGGDVDSSNAIVKKINDSYAYPNHTASPMPTYPVHTPQTAPKFEHGAKLAHELLTRYSGNN